MAQMSKFQLLAPNEDFAVGWSAYKDSLVRMITFITFSLQFFYESYGSSVVFEYVKFVDSTSHIVKLNRSISSSTQEAPVFKRLKTVKLTLFGLNFRDWKWRPFIPAI